MMTLKHILVATDFGEAADAALAYGRALAAPYGATLHVLHIVDNTFLRATLADPRAFESAALRQLEARITDADRQHLRARVVIEASDDPAESIVKYAKANEIDLIVTGTRGRGALPQVLAPSIAERVVRTAPCPVLSVRHPEREFVLPDVTNGGSDDFAQEHSGRH